MTAAAAGDAPSHSVEVERTYDVGELTRLPEWHALPGVDRVGDAEVRELDARYFDTADLALARAGYAVRHRTGGPDEGWHVKGPLVDGGRVELGWPLDRASAADAGEAVPPAVLRAVASVTDAALHPLARIENTRVAYALCSADGGLVAEFVDDRVRAIDLRSQIARAWREWEIELGPAAPGPGPARDALFVAVEAAVTAVGGRPASSASKLARTLGH